MQKKITALLFSIMICISATVSAYEIDAKPVKTIASVAEIVQTEDGVKYSLSLEDAITLALQDNDKIAVCDYQKLSNEYALENAKITKRNYKKSPIYVSSGYEVAYIQAGYYLEYYQSQIDLADKKKEKTIAAITYEVTQNYFNYKLAQNLVDIAQSTYDMSIVNKTNVDKQSQVGMISALEVQNAQLAVDSAHNNLMAMTRNVQTAKDNFMISLGVEEECDFVLTSSIETERFNGNLEADTEKAMTTRFDVLTLNENSRLSQLRFDITDRVVSDSTAAYYTELSTYIQTQQATDTSRKQINLLIKTAYNDVLAAKDQMTIDEQNVSIKGKLYESAKLKFDMGMITNLQLTTALNDYAQAKETLEGSKLKYKLAVEKYNYEITIGLSDVLYVQMQ